MKLLIVDGSVRNAKATPRIVQWVENSAKENLEGVEVETVDLKELNLPRFEEPVSPMMNPERKPEGAVKQWLDLLASADGFVFVTPEYNYSVPSGLKDAIDSIDFQVMKKPFLAVGHGGVGGARAITQLKSMLNGNLGAVPIPMMVNVVGYVGYTNDIDEQGTATTDATNALAPVLKAQLESLVWYAKALKTARE